MKKDNKPVDKNDVLMYVRDKAVTRHPLKLGVTYATIMLGQLAVGGSGDCKEQAYQDVANTIWKSDKYLTAFKRLKR